MVRGGSIWFKYFYLKCFMAATCIAHISIGNKGVLRGRFYKPDVLPQNMVSPTHLLLREGEVFLKGKNRHHFEQRLLGNIRHKLPQLPYKYVQGRLILGFTEEHALLRTIFGLVSYSPALRVDASLDKIQEASLRLLEEKRGTFRVECKRSDKRFPLTSPEINKLVGESIEKNSSLRFVYGKPDMLLGIEINQEGAYLFTETIFCFGGIPTGSEGSVALLVENEASILAGILMMKRGAHVFPVALGDGKAQDDISLLQQYSPVPLRLRVVEDMAALEKFAREYRLDVVVDGKMIGSKRLTSSLVVLRPLIAYTKEAVGKELNYFQEVGASCR